MTENQMLTAGPVVSEQESVATAAVKKYDFCVDDLTVRCKERIVVVAGIRVNLTNAEFNMLETLLRNRGAIVTKAALTEAGLSRPLEKHDRSVDMHISNLRRKIGPNAVGNHRIATARGVGYFFNG